MDKDSVLDMLEEMVKERAALIKEYEFMKYGDWIYWRSKLEIQIGIMEQVAKMIDRGDTRDRDLEEWRIALADDRERWKKHKYK